jgi:hypothetical protein
MRDYGPYPRNTRFGDFRVSAEENLAELVASDAFLYAGSTRSSPADPAALRRVAGFGSSPLVTYPGEGTYFLDRIEKGVWRLEVYPDAVPVRDPFEPPSRDKVVTRAIHRVWPMTVRLPDLGRSFAVQPLVGSDTGTTRASDGQFPVRPGVYLLSASGPVSRGSLPARIGHLGLAEYHAPPAEPLPPAVVSLAAPSYIAGRGAELEAIIADSTPPDSVVLYLRSAAGGPYRAFPMKPVAGYRYVATVPPDSLPAGRHAFSITLARGRSARTFPGGLERRPTDWNYPGDQWWPLEVVTGGTALRLFDPAADAARLAFTRIGDAGRRGLFQVRVSERTGQPVFHLPLPVDSSGWSPADYTASLTILDRVRARGETVRAATGLRLRLRGLGPRQVLHVTLMEQDGTSWSSPVAVGSGWTESTLPLAGFRVARGVKLPQGFPGEWNYWVGPAEGRGGSSDRPKLDRLERLQLSLRRPDGAVVTPEGYGVQVEWVSLEFEPAPATGRR